MKTRAERMCSREFLGIFIFITGLAFTASALGKPFLGQIFQPGKDVASNTGKSWVSYGTYGGGQADSTKNARLVGNPGLKRVAGPGWLKGTGDTTAVFTGIDSLKMFPVHSDFVMNSSDEYSYVFNAKLSPSTRDTSIIAILGTRTDSSHFRQYQLCYIRDSLFLRRLVNGIVVADNTIQNIATSPLIINGWQPFLITMVYQSTGLLSGIQSVRVYNSLSKETIGFIINTSSGNNGWDGTIRFNKIAVSDCGFLRDFNPASTWSSYFGWNVVDSTSQTFPFINKIIYCPPGYGSSTSISSTTSFSGSTTIGNSYSVDGSAFVALELHIGAEAGFLGNGVTMNTLDISGKIGFKYNVNSDKSNTYSFSRTVNNTITTNNEDVVITEDRTIKSFLIRRRTLQYLSDSSASTDTNKNRNCYFIANTPAAVSEMQPYSVSSFISKFKGNKDVIRNFLSLYARDTVTGKIRSDYKFKGKLISPLHLISKAVFEDGSKTVQTSSSSTQRFSWAAGPFAELCVTACGIGAGGSIEAMFSSYNESTATADTTKAISYSYTCPFKWDQIHTNIYEDDLFGSRLYENDQATSFTTCPLEKQTQPSAAFKYVFHKPAAITVGQKAEYRLDITNVSPKGNNLLSRWKPEFKGFTVSDALSSIYQNKITFEPNDIVIPQDSTVSIKIVVSNVPDSKLPLCIWARYGYREDDVSFVEANWDEITAGDGTDTTTIVKHPVQVAKINEFSFNCIQNFIDYNLPAVSPVSIKIFDLKGRQVASAVHAIKNAGQYRENDLTGHLPAGRYLCTFNAGSFSAQKPLNIVR